MWRQLRRRMPLFLAITLGACVGSGFDEGEIGFVEGFFGGIMVDEPRAALIGRDVLQAKIVAKAQKTVAMMKVAKL